MIYIDLDKASNSWKSYINYTLVDNCYIMKIHNRFINEYKSFYIYDAGVNNGPNYFSITLNSTENYFNSTVNLDKYLQYNHYWIYYKGTPDTITADYYIINTPLEQGTITYKTTGSTWATCSGIEISGYETDTTFNNLSGYTNCYITITGASGFCVYKLDDGYWNTDYLTFSGGTQTIMTSGGTIVYDDIYTITINTNNFDTTGLDCKDEGQMFISGKNT